MSTLEDLLAMLLAGVQDVSEQHGLPTYTPWLAGYGAALADLGTLLHMTAMWTENRLDPDILARGVELRSALRRRVLAQLEAAPLPVAEEAPAPTLSASAAAGGGP